MNSKTIISCLGVTCLLSLFVISTVIAGSETFDDSYKIIPGSVFEIRNRDGKIRIEGWNRDQVKVHAIKTTRWGGKLENVKIQVLPGENFSIETIHLVNNPKVSVGYDVWVQKAYFRIPIRNKRKTELSEDE